MILTKLLLNAEINKFILPEKFFSKKIQRSLFHVHLLCFIAVEVGIVHNVERFDKICIIDCNNLLIRMICIKTGAI